MCGLRNRHYFRQNIRCLKYSFHLLPLVIYFIYLLLEQNTALQLLLPRARMSKLFNKINKMATIFFYFANKIQYENI